MTGQVVRGPRAVRADDLGRLRWERAERYDHRLAGLFDEAVSSEAATGWLALVAVGGYGRAEMSPASDVDVVLVHAPDLPPAMVERVAERLWYPLWDEGLPLDHAVRDTRTMVEVAASDWRAALGMLDGRHVAGEAAVSRWLRTSVLEQWRRSAPQRLPELRAAWSERVERAGEIAHAAIPDLKESAGGLRDGVLLRGLVATWLVDVPHGEVEEHRTALLDVRDALHTVTGRRGDRLPPELLPEVAAVLGTDAGTLDRELRGLGRRIAHLVDLTWRRVDATVAGPGRSATRGSRVRRPRWERLGAGLARIGGELVLDDTARPAADPFLGVRAAAVAAEAGLLLAPSTAARLAASAPAVLPDPWPEAARRDLVRLLAAGAGLVPVWEEADHAGLVDRWLPEWSGVRLRRSDSAVHRFTVDRHCIETCVQASRRLRRVARPDLLVLAALLHDIGKPVLADPARDGAEPGHGAAGAPIAGEVGRRFGLDPAAVSTLEFLVRHHLLLTSTAVRRDLDDPATPAAVAGVVQDGERLAMLAALTECDAVSAGPGAWSRWRAGLVDRLVRDVDGLLAGRAPAPADLGLGPDLGLDLGCTAVGRTGVAGPRLSTVPRSDGGRVLVAGADRPGLLADVAGTLATAGLGVQAARVRSADGWTVSCWDVDTPADEARLRLRLDRVIDGSTDLAARLADRDGGGRPAGDAEPRVRVLPDVSATATVLEVRAADRRGLLWQVFRVLADAGVRVRSAHLATLGPQAQDVAYVTDADGRPLSSPAAQRLARTLQRVLDAASEPAPLGWTRP